jgi:hypothetical protein
MLPQRESGTAPDRPLSRIFKGNSLGQQFSTHPVGLSKVPRFLGFNPRLDPCFDARRFFVASELSVPPLQEGL